MCNDFTRACILSEEPTCPTSTELLHRDEYARVFQFSIYQTFLQSGIDTSDILKELIYLNIL